MLQLITAMSELGAGTRGSSLGYAAIRGASFHIQPKFFRSLAPRKVQTNNALLYRHPESPYGKRIRGIVRMYRRISAVVAETLDDGQFPIVISGDHSNAGGTIAGIKQAFPLSRLGVVWIDAHADLHSPYTSPSGNMHGMPLATAIGADNVACKINDPSPVTVDAWQKLKGHPQRVKPSDVAFIGLRSTETPEDHLIAQHDMRVHRVLEVRQKGLTAIVEAVMEQLTHCDMVYVSFDVDSMDPSISEGTGTPVEGGFTLEEARGLLEIFADQPKVMCMEFTEINPLLDKGGNAMGTAAFTLLQSTVYRLQERLGLRGSF